MQLRKIIAMAVAVGAIAAGSVIPSQAHNGPGVCVVAATSANVTNVHYGTNGHPGQLRQNGRYGLYYPPVDPQISDHGMPGAGTGPLGIPNTKGDRYTWTLGGACLNGSIGGGGSYTSSGTGIGFCGRSTGLGTGSITGGHSYITKWESLGSQLILTDSSNMGSVNAQPNPVDSADGSCTNGTAVKFLVDGALIHQDNK